MTAADTVYSTRKECKVPGIRVESWQWDDGNREELARHGLSPRTVRNVAYERPRFRKNRRGRTATHQMIGPDQGGKMWTICIFEILGQPGLWRAVTGWEADPADVDWYRKW
jgi:hypothetical protein